MRLFLSFKYKRFRVGHCIAITHNYTKENLLISVLYQNATTSRILEPRPQGLILVPEICPFFKHFFIYLHAILTKIQGWRKVKKNLEVPVVI